MHFVSNVVRWARRLTYQSGVWSTIGALACAEWRNGMKRVLHIAQLAICFAGVLGLLS
jgi:hypothetical protein